MKSGLMDHVWPARNFSLEGDILMAKIGDKERTVFEELYKTVLDTFDQKDLMYLENVAAELLLILKEAKVRSQSRLSSGGHA
jgi:hypothetical protein